MPEPVLTPTDYMMVQPAPGLPILQIENSYVVLYVTGATYEWKKLSRTSSSLTVTKGNKTATITLTATVTKSGDVTTISNEQYTLTTGGS